MQIKVVGTANLKSMEAQFAALQAQAEAFNKTLAQSAMMPSGGTPAGFRQQAAQMAAMTRAYDSAMAASGAWRVEQVRLNNIIDKNTDLLRRQKLGIHEVFGRQARSNMRQVYKEQLAIQQMMARTVKGGIGDSRLSASLYVPTEVHKSWDTLNNRIGMAGYQLSSASRALLNFGKNTQWAGRQLMAGLTYPMVAFGAAAGVMAYKVDKQLTRIAKVYDTTADQFSSSAEEQMEAQRELDKVRTDGLKTATEAARLYGSSITDTLGVQAELAATGEKGAKLQAATTAVMKSAMLGEIDYQTATKATIALQQQLHASSSELADMWAYMNSVENATSLGMKDFAEAIPIALGPIRVMGGDLHDLGTLMTGMVAQGIEVGKAANAIKALPQRLSRPSKQVQAEFAALTGQDILKINAQHGDNIIDLLTAIYHATQPLEEQARKKVFAGLFGSFQLSTMNAMVQSMGDLENGINQVTDAQNIGRQSATEWRKVQEKEIKAFQDSASGQFKIALESIKASLATAGEPFLEMAAKFLKGANWIIQFFNDLPSAVKKGMAGLLVVGALVGPLIMVTGLLANFAANFGLALGWMMRMVSGFNILNKAEAANMMINKLADKGLTDRATQTQLLTERIQALTVALNEQIAAYARMNGMPIAPQTAATLAATSGLPASTFLGPGASSAGAAPKSRMVTSTQVPWAAATSTTSRMYHGAKITEPVVPLGEQQRRARIIEDMKRNEQARLQAAVATNQQAAAEAKVREKTATALKGSNIAMGAMGASTAAMVVSSNDTVDSIAKWTMMLALGLPIAKGIGVALKGAAAAGGKFVATQYASMTAASGSAIQTAKMAGAARTAGIAMRGVGVAAASIMGPVGWTVTALTAAGVLTYKWFKHEQAITKEKREQANAMYDQKTLLQEQLDIQEKQRERLSVTGQSYAEQGLPRPQDLAEEMKKNDAYKALIGDLQSDDVMDVEKQALAMQKYKDVLEATGGTAEKARLYLEALFIAAGDGALEAQRKALEYGNAIGSTFSDTEQFELWRRQLQSIGNDDDLESIKEQGENLGKTLADSIAEGGHANANRNLERFVSLWTDELPKVWDDLNDGTREELASLGVDTFDELQSIYEQYRDATTDVERFGILQEQLGVTGRELENAARLFDALSGPMEKNYALQEGVVKELAGQLGIEEDITTFKQLQATWEWQLATATQQNAKNLYQQRVHSQALLINAGGLFGMHNKVSDAQKLAIANEILQNANLGQAKTLTEALAMLTGKVASNTDTAAAAAGRLTSAYKLTAENMKSIMQDSMQGVQEDIADAASDAFDDRMNASIDAAQEGWEARQEDLEDRQERQQRRFENRWDRRRRKLQEFYEKREEEIDNEIEAEQRAEDIRQKIFDAEQERISRAAESANRNIDFNVALRTGNLDEAAKISNDATAAMQQWALSDAQAASQGRSDARVDALEAQRDLLDKQRENREKALDQEEERARRHFEKMQELEKESFDKRQENSMDALHERWENEKDAFNDRLTLFKAYIARDQADLERWMKEVGISYDQFGGQVKAKGDNWSKFFQKSLREHIREAGSQIASSNMWEQWGAKEAKKTLLGMGFGTMGKFKRFIQTGELPDDFGKVRKKDTTSPTPGHPTRPNLPDPGYFHKGGWIGEGGSGRKGVARTAGLHPSEVPIIARKGEYMVDAATASKYGPALENMSKGMHIGGPTGIAGLLGAWAAKGLSTGVSKAYETAYNQRTALNVANAIAGMFSVGAAGAYGGRAYSPEQLRNAATIANVGAGIFTGANAARAIEIGIMTAITESGLINVKYGDRDSLGLFQQRPSQGWGTPAQVTNPVYAATQFFNHLKNVKGWASMDPWKAAQAVQRSAFSDGSNYRPYWDDAIGIYTQGLLKSAGGGYVAGTGGMHQATVPGRGWVNSHDYRNPLGTPLYAFNDARVIESRAITSGGSPGNGLYSTPYRSYGETIVLQDANGNKVRYAHLNPNSRTVNVGDIITGGSLIGYSGQTGNASGPHTHFEVNGSELAREWFANHGIGLSKGGYTKKDTPATVHKNEMVIDSKRTKALYGLVDNFTNNPEYWTWLSGMRIGKDGLPLVDPVKGAKSKQGMAAATGKSVRIGTYNVKFSSSNKDTQDDLDKLFGMSDVLSLTEFVASKRGLIPWMNAQGWGVAGATGSNESVVAYNKARFGLGPVGSILMNRTPGRSLSGAIGKGGARRMTAAYAQLKDKVTGSAFWQIAAHTIAHIWKDPALNRRVQQEQYGSLAGLATRLSKSGLPVFIGGDLNNTDSKYFSPLTGAGLVSNWNQNTMAGQPGTFGNAFLDYIFSSRGVKMLGSRVVSGLHSDHRAAIGEFSLPQLSKGGNIRWDNTVANLHKNETVLTEDLSRQFKQGVENFANGGGNVYNTKVCVEGTNATAEEIARAVDKVHKRQANRLPTPRRVVSKV